MPWTCTCNANDGSVYPVSYPVSSPAANSIVGSPKFYEIGTYVNQERVRRGYGTVPFSFTSVIEAAEINSLVTALNDVGYPYGFGGVGQNGKIYLSNVSDIIAKLQAAGAVCICNCNYCTCDCNYCTCDCNWACPCNCNY